MDDIRRPKPRAGASTPPPNRRLTSARQATRPPYNRPTVPSVASTRLASPGGTQSRLIDEPPRPASAVDQLNEKPVSTKPKLKLTVPKVVSLPQNVSRKLTIIIGLVALFLIAAAFAYFSSNGMKLTNYNTATDSYIFPFYKQATASVSGNTTTKLVSKISKGGQPPLMLTLSRLQNKPDDSAIFCYSSTQDRISVKNEATKKDIFLCPTKSAGKTIVYSTVFEANNRWHLLVISQSPVVASDDSLSGSKPAIAYSIEPYKADIINLVKELEVKKRS